MASDSESLPTLAQGTINAQGLAHDPAVLQDLPGTFGSQSGSDQSQPAATAACAAIRPSIENRSQGTYDTPGVQNLVRLSAVSQPGCDAVVCGLPAMVPIAGAPRVRPPTPADEESGGEDRERSRSLVRGPVVRFDLSPGRRKLKVMMLTFPYQMPVSTSPPSCQA